eukprot:UN01993
MGDLLGIGITTQAPTQQTQQSQPAQTGGGGFDDLFGGAFGGGNSNNNNVLNAGPPLSIAFDSNKGNGLEMSLGFKRENNSPVMIVQVNNKMSSGDISRIDIKFNKNYLGIQPTQTVPLNGSVSAGNSQTVDLTLQLSQEPTPKDPLDLTVQMAARSMRSNAAKPPVTMFATAIPAEIFFDNTANTTLTERNSFLGEWRSIPNTEDQSQTIQQCKNSDTQVVKDIFLRNQCSFVADR